MGSLLSKQQKNAKSGMISSNVGFRSEGFSDETDYPTRRPSARSKSRVLLFGRRGSVRGLSGGRARSRDLVKSETHAHIHTGRDLGRAKSACRATIGSSLGLGNGQSNKTNPEKKPTTVRALLPQLESFPLSPVAFWTRKVVKKLNTTSVFSFVSSPKLLIRRGRSGGGTLHGLWLRSGVCPRFGIIASAGSCALGRFTFFLYRPSESKTCHSLLPPIDV